MTTTSIRSPFTASVTEMLSAQVLKYSVFLAPTRALGSAFRRWFSRVFGDILFPLLVEFEIVTEQSLSLSFPAL